MPLDRQRLLAPAIRRPCVLAALRNGIFISLNFLQKYKIECKKVIQIIKGRYIILATPS